MLCQFFLDHLCHPFYWDIDAKHSPQGAIGSDVAGVRNATSGSLTDKLTREHRMTLDEAHLILNTKCGETLESVLKVDISFLLILYPEPLPAPFFYDCSPY